MQNRYSQQFYKVAVHGILVLTVGLIAGLMLTFSLLDSVSLWPLPAWQVEIPGSTRGWQAAHVGGIMNGIMLILLAALAERLSLSERHARFSTIGLIITGWGNTVFYWAGNVASNRGLSMADTMFGPADLAGGLAFAGGGTAMIVTFILMAIYGRAALQLSKA